MSDFIAPLLESEQVTPADIERVCEQLQKRWDEQTGNESAAANRGPAKLDKAVDMRRQEAMSRKQAVTQVVDISSVVSFSR